MDGGIWGIPEWEGMGCGALSCICAGSFPVAAMFAALQFFLFEAADGIVNGILLQLICGIGMGYLSGYFYPSAFFPEKMRMLGELLPSGAARGLRRRERLENICGSVDGCLRLAVGVYCVDCTGQMAQDTVEAKRKPVLAGSGEN